MWTSAPLSSVRAIPSSRAAVLRISNGSSMVSRRLIYRKSMCGVQTIASMPSSAAMRHSSSDVSRLREPSSIPGRMCE
jgi:hypothetical protein